MGDNDQHFRGSSLSAPGMSYSYTGRVTASGPSTGGFGGSLYRGSALSANKPQMTYKYTGVTGSLDEVAQFTAVADAVPLLSMVVDGNYKLGNTETNPDNAEDSVELVTDGNYDLGDTHIEMAGVTPELIEELSKKYADAHKSIWQKAGEAALSFGASLVTLTYAAAEGLFSLAEALVDGVVSLAELAFEGVTYIAELAVEGIDAVLPVDLSGVKDGIKDVRTGVRTTVMDAVRTDLTGAGFSYIFEHSPMKEVNAAAWGCCQRGGFVYDVFKETSYWAGMTVISTVTGGAVNPVVLTGIATMGKKSQENLQGVDLSDDAAYFHAQSKTCCQALLDMAVSGVTKGFVDKKFTSSTFWGQGLKKVLQGDNPTKARKAVAFIVNTLIKSSKELGKEGINAAWDGTDYNWDKATKAAVSVALSEVLNEFVIGKAADKIKGNKSPQSETRPDPEAGRGASEHQTSSGTPTPNEFIADGPDSWDGYNGTEIQGPIEDTWGEISAQIQEKVVEKVPEKAAEKAGEKVIEAPIKGKSLTPQASAPEVSTHTDRIGGITPSTGQLSPDAVPIPAT